MKRVLITGGNKGIGLEITKKFLDSNFEVIVVARDFKEFPYKEKVKTIEFDLQNFQGAAELVKQIGAIDILINNAGIMNSLPFDNYSGQKTDELMAINVKTPIALITEFAKSMEAQGSGRIVSLASIAGHIGHPDIWYGISKSAVINFTKSFAKLLGPQGIVINCVAPAATNTDMLSQIPEERKKQTKANTYLNRFAEPEEVARVVYWLSVDAPEYINGTCIDINNGAFPR